MNTTTNKNKHSISIRYCKKCEQRTQHDLIDKYAICCLCNNQIKRVNNQK